MKNSINNFELVYHPKQEKGEELFDGLPCPTKEAYDILGEEGIKYIKNRLHEMLEWRKTMYGGKEKRYYGFSAMQFFTELQTEIIFSVGLTIDDLKYRKDRYNEKIPELVISNHLTENNFEKLHKTNHFLIEPFAEYFYYHPNISIPEYYMHYFEPDKPSNI